MNILRNFYYRHRFVSALGATLVVFIFMSCGLVMVNAETLEPADMHIVSVYADGKELSIPSRAKTVGELLERTDIVVGENDIVEPAKDAVIDTDGYRVRIARARAYTVLDEGKEYASVSAHNAPRLIAEAAGLKLNPADKAEFAKPNELSGADIGRYIKITRSKTVQVSVYGSLQTVSTNAVTVGDLLKELTINPLPTDQVSPNPADVLRSGAVVYVNRNGVVVVTEEVAIDPPIEYVEDLGLTLGSTAVRDPGAPGKKIVTYEITTVNGTETARREISSSVVVQPQTKVVARGRAAGQIGDEKQSLMAAAGITPDEYAAADYIIGRESGWCATKWQGQWGQCPSFYEEKYPGAENDKSLGFGLCQSTPAIKMASAGDDWRTNPVTHLKWCTNYARARYGGWNKAYEVWIVQKWW